MFNKINQIPILSILNRLSIPCKNLGPGTYGVLQDGKLTNGRRVNTKENYIHDFSGKGRPNGPPFSFIKAYLNLTSYETFKRYESNFNIKNEIKYPKNKGSPHKQKKYKVVEPYTRNNK